MTALVPAPVPFREVRGVVRALGYGGSDAFRDGNGDIEGVYVDGLSITVGTPRTHVFTLAHGVSDAFEDNQAASCPCDGGSPAPAFVGTDFLCEEPFRAANPSDTSQRFFDESDVLFDGLDIEDTMCVGAAESADDFQVDIGFTTTDALELRLMGTEDITNEDLAIILLELWVR